MPLLSKTKAQLNFTTEKDSVSSGLEEVFKVKRENKSLSSNVTPYNDAHEHLLDELRWLNRLIAAHVLRLRRVNFYEGVKDFQGFFIAEDEIDTLLRTGIFEEDGKLDDNERAKQMAKLLSQAQDIRKKMAQHIQISVEQGIFLPLVQLGKCFHLTEFELQALIICIAPQIDARYEKLYTYLQNDITKKFPSVDLILSLITQHIEDRLHLLSYLESSAPLRNYGLLESLENGTVSSAAQHFLRPNSRIVHYVLGSNAVDQRVLPYVRFLPFLNWEDVVVSNEVQNRLQKIFQFILDETADQRSTLHLYGRPGVGKKTIAQALCKEVGVSLAVVDVRSLMLSQENFVDQVRLILREGLLQPCAVYFDHVEKLEVNNSEKTMFFTRLAQEIREMGWLTFLGSENPLPTELFDTFPIYAVEIPAPDYAAQKKLWEMHLDGALAENEKLNLDQLIAHFDLTGGQIERAIRLTEQNAFVRGAEDEYLTLFDFVSSCRKQSQPKLVGLAQKIEPVHTWDDIVLPDDTIAQLREICQRVTHRHKVLAEWGFDQKFSQGKGVNALFAGPTGTGKTMAAEIVANELGLDLYKIDLSGVVSKYIGETEKNLNRIFAVTKHTNAILFFDEADALFGKRSEVRDSHDRYANIEISYLLQKMEQHEGLTILATNLKGNLDEAFTRRLAFTVHFPFPDEDSRIRIWNRIWPSEIPLAKDIDLNFIASKFKLNGGNIKNIALTAAFLSAENCDTVTMIHLFQAIKREYQKMGKKLNLDEFGHYIEMAK